MATRSERPLLAQRIATPLAWLGRQLLLVPEAVLLLTLLALHSTLGASPLLGGLGLVCALSFVLRMSLLALSRRTLAAANYVRAGQLVQAALWIYPASADAQALRGAIHLARGEAWQARQALQRAVELFPLQAELHAALSAALLEAGRPSEALVAAQRALDLDPAVAVAWLHLAGAESQLGAPHAQIERQLRTGLALPAAPADEAALRCALANLMLADGRSDEARQTLAPIEPILASCSISQQAGLHFYLGDLLGLLDYPEQARAHFQASERLDPHGRHAAAAWRAARMS
jgi:tetratricopeptide (TPR) repeat protein